MKKIKNRKQRENKTDKMIVGLIIVSVFFLGVATLGLNLLRNQERQYTYNEILHDHDGDGTPDHPIDFHE